MSPADPLCLFFQTDTPDFAGNDPVHFDLYITQEQLDDIGNLNENFPTVEIEDFYTHHPNLQMTRQRISHYCSDKWPAYYAFTSAGETTPLKWFMASSFKHIWKIIKPQLVKKGPRLCFVSEVSTGFPSLLSIIDMI